MSPLAAHDATYKLYIYPNSKKAPTSSCSELINLRSELPSTDTLKALTRLRQIDMILFYAFCEINHVSTY